MPKKKTNQSGKIDRKNSIEWVFQFWAWQLLVWSLYRYFFKFSEPIDEFVVKPLVFIIPVLWFVLRIEKRTLETVGLTIKNFFHSAFIGLGFGLLFSGEAILANTLKNGSLIITPLETLSSYGIWMIIFLSLATAFSEEILSRGFFFSRIFEVSKNLLHASLMSTFLFVVFHIPILVTSLKFQGTTLVLFLVTSFVLGLTNSMVYYKTKSLVGPVLIHFFWNVTVAVFL